MKPLASEIVVLDNEIWKLVMNRSNIYSTYRHIIDSVEGDRWRLLMNGLNHTLNQLKHRKNL